MPDTRINRPGASTNPPHTAREGTDISDYHPDPGPAVPEPEDHDPHPSDEGHPYDGDPNPRAVGPRDRKGARDRAQGSTTPLRYLDIYPNPAIHTGTPERKPDNADHGPKYSTS